ncbi:MAG: hypothetical protein R6X34_06105 [Chloroflexota bacterium]
MSEQPFILQNIQMELAQRTLPATTVWNRLEGRPRTLNFDRALKAEVRDALWFISRQWQMGEFQGDDAGSPVLSRVHLDTTQLQEYRPNGHDAEMFPYGMPLETEVEKRPFPFNQTVTPKGGVTPKIQPMALDLRLLMGRHWLKLLTAAPGLSGYAQDFIDAYVIADPDPTDRDDGLVAAHPEAWSVFAAVAGRRMDGGQLYLYLKENPANHAFDDIPAVLPGDQAAIDALAARFVAWFERLYCQPAAEEADAWIPDRLEYQFAVSAPVADGEKVLTAEEYYNGRLDWFNFDLDPEADDLNAPLPVDAPDPRAAFTKTFVPTQISFDGMPYTRWWTFEDNRTNFGDIKPDTTDLSKLLLIEFGLVYANDWFLLPFELPVGSIANIRGITVTNVFNERIWVEPAGRGADDDWQRWSMFTLNIAGENEETADASLLLLPTSTHVLESKPLEQAALIRDEMANMVWGIETQIALPTGWSKAGAEAAHEYHNFLAARLRDELAVLPPAEPPKPAAAIRYQVMNSVPEQWIPFVPVHMENDNRQVQLQRAAMPRILPGDPEKPEKIRPRTTLLRSGLEAQPLEPYFLHEEEVPRAGVRVQQTFKRTRWHSGQVFTWLGVSKHTGRGEGSSGLAFDQIRDTRREDAG